MSCPRESSGFHDSVSLDSLLRHVMPVVPKLPYSMALDMLRQAYIEFSRKTGLLVANHVQDYQAGVLEYEIVAPTDYEVYSIIGIDSPGHGWYDFVRGSRTGFGDGYNYGFSKGNLFTAFGMQYEVIDNKILKMNSAPSVDTYKGLNIFFKVLPADCVSTIPKSIANPFGRGIAQKVIADALCIPNKEWTAPSLGQKYELTYNRIILSGRQLAMTNRRAGPMMARPVRIL